MELSFTHTKGRKDSAKASHLRIKQARRKKIRKAKDQVNKQDKSSALTSDEEVSWPNGLYVPSDIILEGWEDPQESKKDGIEVQYFDP